MFSIRISADTWPELIIVGVIVLIVLYVTSRKRIDVWIHKEEKDDDGNST